MSTSRKKSSFCNRKNICLQRGMFLSEKNKAVDKSPNSKPVTMAATSDLFNRTPQPANEKFKSRSGTDFV